MIRPGAVSYEHVKKIVSSFSDSTLQKLALGPLPVAEVEEGCRVCSVLEPMERHAGATVLMEWHDLVSKGFKVLGAILDGDHDEEAEDGLIDEATALIAELSYARCLVIYGFAEAELESRRLANVEDGLSADGEPEDDRDPAERRRDEEAEDAERRLDAEKAGDLPASYPPAVDQA
jgi:hypothetical protein